MDINKVGYCNYCGQVINIEGSGAEGAEESTRNDAATCRCDCEGGKREVRKQIQISNARTTINEILEADDDGVNLLDDKAVKIGKELLNAAVVAVVDGDITKLTINIAGGTKVTISRAGKDKVSVERSDTLKIKEEV